MNVNSNINKLLYALSQRGRLYKVNSLKFYNKNKEKYSTRYEVLKKQPNEEKYRQDFECYGKIELLKYLVKEYEGSEANEI